ncbi:4-aminobutyrate aminotransferase : Acetylornithine aminotransferase OS=uncultured planctomycete GN=argD PE=3 SV=1: Aminotran_3 [Gemmata massiliana]|uniref:4-aminobutyrate--2-oxoglutarate transaminase n=1 Tax=Gemmata massiliana TaxID=1210884 RepID=A0A6P2DES9_9BACT|nr:acetyl ornithine aminotransferase family protein [Gemmata massiliana]VTS00100.1 4-aminobutyrate aminotransferase : Acetylornithine aminotransferase OS=uncultured planctomycete GN=argD PE=3 SV=1: Aminotran_3 [Gemmata massiliana]
MFQFDHLTVPDIRTPLPGPNGAEMLARDKLYVSPSYTPMYPLFVDVGSGSVIRDVDGNLFLDFTAGIAVTNTGHCHPEVVAAIQDQAAKLLHMSGTDFYYRPQIDLAEKLAKIAPGPSPKKVFFANSGAETIEGALKLARWHTERNRVVAFFGAFHGRTYGAMSLSGSKLVHRRGFSPLVPDIHHVEFPRTCPEGEGGADKCRLVKNIEETIFKRTCPPEEVAAIFVEPIQGEGGYHPIPQNCLPALRALCDKHGILLVVDEVQSGMGRTGKMFAVEHYGVEPDIICSAKGIASGMPLGAIIAKAEVMDWPPGSHASTFGGNPVSCRAALASIELLEREYMANATVRGEQLRAGLRELSQKHAGLTNVRGLGLMTAADLPSGAAREKVIQTAFERGLLLLGCGETALRFCPPLCISAAQVDTALTILDGVLGTIEPAKASTPASTSGTIPVV